MRRLPLLLVALVVATGLQVPVFGQGSQTASADAIAIITKFYADQTKVNLTNDPKVTVPFYEKNYADDMISGSSRGTWDTKQSLLAAYKDPKNNKFTSESIGDLKVWASGDVVVATYKDTYDALVSGEHYARAVICTDVFQQRRGAWVMITNHCSQAAK